MDARPVRAARWLLVGALLVTGGCSALIGSKRAVYLPGLHEGALRADLEEIWGPPVAERATASGSRATYLYAPAPAGKREYMTLEQHVGLFLTTGEAFANAGEAAILWPVVYAGTAVVAETVATTRVVLRMLSGRRFLAGRVYTVEVDYDQSGRLRDYSRASRRATPAERERILGAADPRHSGTPQSCQAAQ